MPDTRRPNNHIRIATRGSRLALAQVELATAALRVHAPEISFEVVEISTQGDRDRTTPLSVLGGQGVFVAAVREAILDGRADIAVHSLKDVPATSAEGLVFAAMLKRGDPRDCLVARDGATLSALAAGARVGTGSARRAALLRALRPDHEVASIRGNVDTRIQKVRDGDYDAAILAYAGLERLGRADEATQVFEAAAFLPSPGQGIIAVECRADQDAREWLARADHAETRAAAEAERGVLAALGAGCDVPVGAYAQVDGDLLALRAFVARDGDGTLVFGDATGSPAGGEALGRGLGERLLAAARDSVEDAS